MTSNQKHLNLNSIGELYKSGIKEVAVAIGVFDGVHIGHRHLLRTLIKMSDDHGVTPVALTFHPHPREVLRPSENLLLIVSHEKKIELLHEAGVKAVVTFPFTKEFSELSAETFLEQCLMSGKVRLRGICVGKNWKFGAGGSGNTDTINAFSKRHALFFKPVGELKIDGRTVSSSEIRRAVSGGLLESAARMLGRNYSISGTVEHGEKIASKLLDCPTANIYVSHGIIPPKGVYMGYAKFADSTYPAAISVGTAPTFVHKKSGRTSIEAHLFGFTGDIYGRNLEIEFVKYLREERTFSSPDSLKKQISEDLQIIRKTLHCVSAL